jgi:hypothetical protein
VLSFKRVHVQIDQDYSIVFTINIELKIVFNKIKKIDEKKIPITQHTQQIKEVTKTPLKNSQ